MDDTQKIHNQNKKFCPKCGAESDISAKFCPKCGKDFNGDQVNSQMDMQRPPTQAPYGQEAYRNVNPPRESSKGLGTGAVVAIIISGMVAAILLIFIVYNVVIKDKNIQNSNENMNAKIEELKRDTEAQELKNKEAELQRLKEQAQQKEVEEKEKEIRELREKLERKPSTTSAPVVTPAPAPAPNPAATDSSYIISTSNTNELTFTELDYYTRGEIELARNEIYARRGYMFKEQRFKDYFGNKTWYVPNPGFHDGMFNSVEKANIDCIVAYERTMGWR